MKSNRICQSCSMPLDDIELYGTEKDGSPKKNYCRYCYENGAFVNPQISLEEMKIRVSDRLKMMNIDDETIDTAISTLPNLKRWRGIKDSVLNAI